jgi:nanoRNase/pAp phosphatase (c-di-AMP/oligoRNAs hydrolase)
MNKAKKKLKQLHEMLNHNSTMLIVLQDNPDPDALGSAAALRKVVNQHNTIQCSITHRGTIGRAENRALVKYLGLNLRQADQIDFQTFDLIAMVDTQPGTGNNCLPKESEPDIVIDHHPCRKDTRRCRFTDIRSRYGATSTILTEYLNAAGIDMETTIATALLYGIRSDTQDLGRDTTAADINALMTLYPKANKRILSQIQRGLVQRDYFRLLSLAISNAKVWGKSAITSLGQVENPDMIGEMADLILRDDQLEWVLSYGFYQKKLLLSLRSDAENPPASKVVRHIVGRRGSGGGHLSYAGGQIPIDSLTQKDLAKLVSLVEKAFLKQVEPTQSKSTARRLVEDSAK